LTGIFGHFSAILLLGDFGASFIRQITACSLFYEVQFAAAKYLRLSVIFAGFVKTKGYNLVCIVDVFASLEDKDVKTDKIHDSEKVGMRKKRLYILSILSLSIMIQAAISSGAEDGILQQRTQAFVGQDLHVTGRELISYQLATGEHVLVFRDGLSILIGANQFSGDNAVVWLESVATEFRGRARIDYKATAYLKGSVSIEKAGGARTTDLSQTTVEDGRAVIVQFGVSGEVFVTADRREISDPRESELYIEAVTSCRAIGIESRFVVEADIPMPELPPKKPGMPVVRPEAKEPRFMYPVNIAPVEEVAPSIEWDEEKGMGTVVGRFYLWQKQDEKGGLLELQADNAVIFSSPAASDLSPVKGLAVGQTEKVDDSAAPTVEDKEQSTPSTARDTYDDILSSVRAIYMSGNVVMAEGQRTIRADEVYYDFERKKAIAVNAVMRNFDASRGIPIYVRAEKLRQVAENKFAAENITITSSEFYLPQISLNASEVIITDTTSIEEQEGKITDRSFDAQMRDVRLKMYDKTLFYWPFMRSNLQRPDIPFKSIHAGYGKKWGTSIESRWYLARLLGLREPKGTESTLALDYYSKRGFGGGIDIEYKRENYFGRLMAYIIHDTGEDRLGRSGFRKDIEPPRELRGRFLFQHRHFLPYNWQLTTEVSYLSDENFLEEYYRGEFNSEKEQETTVHLKRIENNWGLSFLGKARINDFADKLEEMPTAEFHWTGQSLFDDRFTLYSDTQISRLRQRIGNEHAIMMDEGAFSFASHRTELDMPVRMNSLKVVPFIAGTFGYDDRSGFRRSLVDGNYMGQSGEEDAWIGEAGVRVSSQPLWKVYPDVKSRLWDLNQLRHVVRPYLVAVGYLESDSVVEQHDALHVGISQRLQTKRGTAHRQRTVDWMWLDAAFTWVSDSESAGTSGADRFIWSRPIVPMRVLSAPGIFNGDLMAPLQRFEMFGPRRNYFSADYVWRLSDTTAVLSDMNYDMQSGVVQQLNVGFSRLRWPNLSYYIGSRYLRRTQIAGEQGSNAFTFAATYMFDPRYTIVFSQQFDFDYGANIRSDISLIRRYHRMYWALTYSADESLDSHAIIFSIWPEGVPEMSFGPRRYMDFAGPASY